jgi:hypothetical protein
VKHVVEKRAVGAGGDKAWRRSAPGLPRRSGGGGKRPQLVMRFGYGPDVRHSAREKAEDILVDPPALQISGGEDA